MQKRTATSSIASKRVHVISRGDRWAVKKEGNTKASKLYGNKEAAVKGARRLASAKMDVVIHRKDGSIQKWDKGM